MYSPRSKTTTKVARSALEGINAGESLYREPKSRCFRVWARWLNALCIQPRLLRVQYVLASVRRNKTDASDASALPEATYEVLKEVQLDFPRDRHDRLRGAVV